MCALSVDTQSQHTATHRNTCNTLQQTASHCNTLQHTATHCNTRNTLQRTTTHCNALQHTSTHYNTLQHTATHCNALQHTATHYDTLQHNATHCNTLHTDMRGNSITSLQILEYEERNTGWRSYIRCLIFVFIFRKRAL